MTKFIDVICNIGGRKICSYPRDRVNICHTKGCEDDTPGVITVNLYDSNNELLKLEYYDDQIYFIKED